MNKYKIWIALILSLTSFTPWAEEGDTETGSNTVTTAKPDTAQVQEYRFVTDELRLTMYKNSNGSGRVKLLSSGDRLAVLEKSGSYARVRDNAGVSGWVKYNFLQVEPPATQLLIEEKDKNRILSEQIEEFSDTKKLVEDYENTISLMQADLDGVNEKLKSNEQQVAQLGEDNQALQQQLDQARKGEVGLNELLQVLRSYWYGLALLGLLLLGVGFIIGRSIVESQIKRRFHGVKVW